MASSDQMDSHLHGDQERAGHHQGTDRRKKEMWKKKISNIAIAALLLMSLFLIILSLAIPEIQSRRYIANLRSGGANVNTVYEPIAWLEKTTGYRFLIYERIVGIDFRKFPTTDQDLRIISSYPSLRYVELQGTGISEDAVSNLLVSCLDLRQLQIISCPEISPAYIDKLRSKYPSLTVSYRGIAYLGIAGQTHPQGCVISYLDPKKPAELAGAKKGDILTAFDSKAVKSFEQLVYFIGECAPGDEVVLDVIRQNEKLSLPCILGDWNDKLR